MANIPIYGTLINDTDGIIARADQILDPRTGKLLTEALEDIQQGGGNINTPNYTELTAEEITQIAKLITNK